MRREERKKARLKGKQKKRKGEIAKDLLLELTARSLLIEPAMIVHAMAC